MTTMRSFFTSRVWKMRRDSSGRVQGFSNSVWYFGASALALFIRSSIPALSSFGSGDVWLSNGSPTSTKNSSCPAGVHMHSICTVLPEVFLKTCGALAGMFTLHPARMVVVSPRKVNSSSPSSSVNISSKSWRCGGGPAAIGHDHVDQAVPSGCLCAGNEDTVGAADHCDVAHLGTIRIGDGQLAVGIVGRDSRVRCNVALAASLILMSPQ